MYSSKVVLSVVDLSNIELSTEEYTMIEIRNMKPEDYDQVYDLWIHTPGMGLNHLDDSREGIEKYLKRNPDTCYLALENQMIIGAIMCGHDGRRGMIYHTVVKEEHRGRGIGRRLVEAAMHALEKEGIHKVGLLVFGRNEIGNKFWEKMGFTERTDIVYRNKCIKELIRIDT